MNISSKLVHLPGFPSGVLLAYFAGFIDPTLLDVLSIHWFQARLNWSKPVCRKLWGKSNMERLVMQAHLHSSTATARVLQLLGNEHASMFTCDDSISWNYEMCNKMEFKVITIYVWFEEILVCSSNFPSESSILHETRKPSYQLEIADTEEWPSNMKMHVRREEDAGYTGFCRCTCSLDILPPDWVASLAFSRSWASSTDLTWEKSRASVTLENRDCLLFLGSSFSFFSSTLAETTTNFELLLSLWCLGKVWATPKFGEKLLCEGDKGRTLSPMFVSSLRIMQPPLHNRTLYMEGKVIGVCGVGDFGWLSWTSEALPRVWKQHGYHSENLVVKEGDVALCLTIVIERREISPQNIQTCQSNWDMLKTNPVSEAKVT